jgi:C4-type Zn-finger protein
MAFGRAIEVRGMNSGNESEIEVRCPCCGATLKIDALLGRVIWHEAAPKPKKSGHNHLDRAGDVLEKQAAQREAHFRESAEEQKVKADVLSRKFEEALKKTRDVPVRPGLRDIDLD